MYSVYMFVVYILYNLLIDFISVAIMISIINIKFILIIVSIDMSISYIITIIYYLSLLSFFLS